MALIVPQGPPAAGKLTGRREVSALTGFPLFRSHLVIDLAQSVFTVGTMEFVELREQLRPAIIGRAAAEGVSGRIFKFTPGRSISDGFV